ncbi:hypothetical protein CEXT_709481 [Caerostris extrusa]|uniref:Uncharacterized protein n=1 Tax=Caerostris extrusa TaxID=172846 RepID=A0AAV4UL08_CAEEX|nr:hypothetical protein CEXT_709481 [Caerostris extrusa]
MIQTDLNVQHGDNNFTALVEVTKSNESSLAVMQCNSTGSSLLRSTKSRPIPFYQGGCPLIYMRYSYQHTACRPPNPRCTIYSRGISQPEKRLHRLETQLPQKFSGTGLRKNK